MRQIERRRVKTITAANNEEYDKLFNETADKLAGQRYEVKDFDQFTSRFYYSEDDEVSESLEDDFSLNGERCTCNDCPFLQMEDDARRKWFKCEYATYGETSRDSRACSVFYREAVKLMREKAKK